MSPWGGLLLLGALFLLSLVHFTHASDDTIYRGLMYIQTCPSQGNRRNDIPNDVLGLCTGDPVTGDGEDGMIEIESVEFAFNSRLPDSVYGDAQDVGTPQALKKKKKKEVSFPSLGNGKGYLDNLLGTIGFGSLTITKRPDSSSAALMQLAADNEGIYNALSSCPPVMYVVLEIPLGRLQGGTDRLFISIVPAIITEWHLSLPTTTTGDDVSDYVREQISFKYGGMTYAYGYDDDPAGLITDGLTQASCNLDVFCNLYPCVCTANPDGRRTLTNWFDVLECNAGVNIFDPIYIPPTLEEAFANNTIGGIDSIKANYLNDLWK